MNDKIYRWLDTQLSIARFYGGINIDGVPYKVDKTDPDMPLIRVGTPSWEQDRKTEKQAEDKAEAARAKEAQGVMF